MGPHPERRTEDAALMIGCAWERSAGADEIADFVIHGGRVMGSR